MTDNIEKSDEAKEDNIAKETDEKVNEALIDNDPMIVDMKAAEAEIAALEKEGRIAVVPFADFSAG